VVYYRKYFVLRKNYLTTLNRKGEMAMILIKCYAIAAVFLVTAQLLPGVHIKNFWMTTLIAVALSIVNSIVAALLFVPSLPVNILVLRMFALLGMNAVMVLLATIFPYFAVDSFWWSMLLAWIVVLVKICTP